MQVVANVVWVQDTTANTMGVSCESPRARDHALLLPVAAVVAAAVVVFVVVLLLPVAAALT